MKPLFITTILVLAVCIYGCNAGWGSDYKAKQDTLREVSKYRGEMDNYLVWLRWFVEKKERAVKILERSSDGFGKLSNYEQAIILKNKVFDLIDIFKEELPEKPTSTYFNPTPKPTPMPIDTLPNKKIKNLDKMKPRWRK